MDDKTFPDSMKTVGGLIGDIAAYTMQQAHRPNWPLAFAGALAFVAFAAGRRYRTAANTRPNLFIIAHGWSGVGKDAPRKTNSELARACDILPCVMDDFRSGEGLQDTLLSNPVCLSQYDEVDGLFNAAGVIKDTFSDGVRREMLKLWGAAGSFIHRRKLAASRFGKDKDKTPDYVAHPAFTLFGTGVTKDVYEAVTSKMASDGFFARLLVIDAGKRTGGHAPIYSPPPFDVVERCKTLCGWREILKDGKRQLWPEMTPDWSETGTIIPQTEGATKAAVEIRAAADGMYNNDEDGPENSLWGRAVEKCERLALVFALSENPAGAVITDRHYALARDLVWYCTAEQLRLLGKYSAENEYQAMQKRILRILDKGRTCKRDLLKRTHLKASDLDEMLDTLAAQNELIFVNDKGEEQPLDTCHGKKGVYFARP